MNTHSNRRQFLKQAARLTAGSILGSSLLHSQGQATDTLAQTVLPRWRGFNLQYFFGTWSDGIPVEDDFRMISDLGFDFVRLPLWYILWIEKGDIYKINESYLTTIDKAVNWAGKYGLHMCINFHRAPGYCVAAKPQEPFILWNDQEALDAFCFHWKLFAERYKGISGDQMSFNLVNEPICGQDKYHKVVKAAVETIRSVSPDRLIIADGLMGAALPAFKISDLDVAQSCRGYFPHTITHYKASWMHGSSKFPEPQWPNSRYLLMNWNRDRLESLYAPWAKAARDGIGVHCGECGCHNQTPHDIFLRWFRDVLEVLTSHGIGYALWNFRGSFGILDSGRKDVVYEDWHGHKLDRELLNLIQEF